MTAAIGWAVIAYGIRGMLHHHLDTRPASLVDFLVGGAVLHDLLWVPLVLLLGVAVTRLVPPLFRDIVQAALIVSGSLVAFSYPLVRDFAANLHNPSSLPHNYTANLLLVLGAVWLIAAVVALRRVRTGGGSGSGSGSG
ncbi:MAG TPA: hypothetical protein VHT30_06605 [Acidimicrobiales bacterium]|nr:hypothetical protein [Acidimicrobiales bacterium]